MSATPLLQRAQAFTEFATSHPEFEQTRSLDDLRAWEYARLDRAGQVFLDYTAGGVYADNGTIPDQDVVGFISGPGSLSQTVTNLVANTPYQLSFSYNAQSAPGAKPHLQVKAAGKVVVEEDVAPVGGANPYHIKTVTFTPTDTSAEIAFPCRRNSEMPTLEAL